MKKWEYKEILCFDSDKTYMFDVSAVLNHLKTQKGWKFIDYIFAEKNEEVRILLKREV